MSRGKPGPDGARASRRSPGSLSRPIHPAQLYALQGRVRAWLQKSVQGLICEMH